MTSVSEIKSKRDVPVVVANQDGVITFVNERFTTLLRWPKDALLGKPLTTIIPGSLRDAHHLGFSRFLATSRPTLLEQVINLKVVTGDGQELLAEHFIVAEKDNKGRWMFAATIHPQS